MFNNQQNYINGNTIPIPDATLSTRFMHIRNNVAQFWQNNTYINHLTHHGVLHSENIYSKKLSSIVGQLPTAYQLSPDEAFIISAACFLFEIGLQSPNIEKFVGEYTLPLNETQLQQVMKNRHDLTYELILNSVDANYSGQKPELGLAPDDYVYAIAEVCRHCSPDIPIHEVKEELPVAGFRARIRLMVALLRLADQLYIEPTRVNMERLVNAKITTAEKTKYWLYNYSETVILDNGLIHFYYRLPAEKNYLVSKIRSVLEPQFTLDRNPIMQFLQQKHNVRLALDPAADILEMPRQFSRDMNNEVEQYLRTVKEERSSDPMLSVGTPSGGVSNRRGATQKALFVVFYENFLLQIGKMGAFLNEDQLDDLLIELITTARAQHAELFDHVAIGDWQRIDLQSHGEMLTNMTFQLEDVGISQITNTTKHFLDKTVFGSNTYSKIIFVTPPTDVVSIIKDAGQRRMVFSWIADLEETDIYRILDFKVLHHLVDFPAMGRFDQDAIEPQEDRFILAIDELLTRTAEDLTYDAMRDALQHIELLTGTLDWWLLHLANTQIIHVNTVGHVSLNDDDQRVRDIRQRVDSVLDTFMSYGDDAKLSESELAQKLISQTFRSGSELKAFLENLGQINVLYVDRREERLWSLNTQHIFAVRSDADLNLSLFILGVDHFLIGEGHPVMHEHTLHRNLKAYLSNSMMDMLKPIAIEQTLINVKETNKKHRGSGNNIVELSLLTNTELVAVTLLNRDILFDVLYRAKDGFSRNALVNKLKQISSFETPSKDKKARLDYINGWLDALENARLIETVVPDSNDGGQPMLKLNTREKTVQRVMGRRNLFGLVKQMRLLRAAHPNHPKPTSDVIDKLKSYVTRGDHSLASWTLDAAKAIRLVKVNNKNRDANVKGDQVFMAHHSVLRDLDKREDKVVAQLLKVVKQNARGGWAQHKFVKSEMERQWQTFGKSREEHEYWIEQAIYRQKKLERKGRGRQAQYKVR